MPKKTHRPPKDATPEVHRYAEPEMRRYGTYNIQPTTDTDNLFPLIGPGLPQAWQGLAIGKDKLEE